MKFSIYFAYAETLMVSTLHVVFYHYVKAQTFLKPKSAGHLLIISLLSFKGQDFVDPYKFRVWLTLNSSFLSISTFHYKQILILFLYPFFLSFSSTGSNFNTSKISSFLFWSKRVYTSLLVKKLISNEVNYFYPLF